MNKITILLVCLVCFFSASQSHAGITYCRAGQKDRYAHFPLSFAGGEVEKRGACTIQKEELIQCKPLVLMGQVMPNKFYWHFTGVPIYSLYYNDEDMRLRAKQLELVLDEMQKYCPQSCETCK